MGLRGAFLEKKKKWGNENLVTHAFWLPPTFFF